MPTSPMFAVPARMWLGHARYMAALSLACALVGWTAPRGDGLAETLNDGRTSALVAADLDADGAVDSVRVLKGDPRQIRITLRQRSQDLVAPLTTELVGLATADVDRDGDQDLFGLGTAGRLFLWTNRGGGFALHSTVTPFHAGHLPSCGSEHRLWAREGGSAYAALSFPKWLVASPTARPIPSGHHTRVVCTRERPPTDTPIHGPDSRGPPLPGFSRTFHSPVLADC